MADTAASSTPSAADLEFINLGVETLRQRAAEFAAEMAFKNKRLELVDIPMTQLERDKLAYQASVAAADAAYRDRKFDQIDLPMLQLAYQQDGRAGLQQMLDGRLREYGLMLEGEKVEDMMNRTALQSAQLQMDDSYRRDRMASLEVPGLQLDATKVQQQGLQAALDDYYRIARTNNIDIPEEQRKYIETGMQGMQQAASIAAQYAQMGLTAQQIQAQLQQQGMQGYEAVANTAVKYAQMGQTADQIQDQLLNTSLKSLVASGELAAKYAAMGLDAQTVQNATQALGMQAIQAGMADNLATAGVNVDQAKVALQAAQQGDDTALKALQLAASLQGPKNAFQQQAVMWGLNRQGLSRSVDAISGKYDLPTTQANQANPEAIGLGSLGQDILAAGGQTGQQTGTDIANQIAGTYAGLSQGGFDPNAAARAQLGQYGTQQLGAQVNAPTAPNDVTQGMNALAQQAQGYQVSRPEVDPALYNAMMGQAGLMAGAQVTQPNVNDNLSYADLIRLAGQAAGTQLQGVNQNTALTQQLGDTVGFAGQIAQNAQAQNTGQAGLQLAQQAGQNAINNTMPVLPDNQDLYGQLQEFVNASRTGGETAIGNVGTGNMPAIVPGAPGAPAAPGGGGAAPGAPIQPKNLDNVEALSAIWDGRPDLQQFFQQRGWDVSRPEQKAAAVAEWGKLACAAGDPAWVAAGGDAVALMQQNNWQPNPRIWQPVRALEDIGTRLGDGFVAWVSGAAGGDEFDYNRGVQLGGKGQKLWGPDWRYETATPAQKWQLQRMWVSETAAGIAFGKDPIYALRELGGVGAARTPWLTAETLTEQSGRPLGQLPTVDEGARHMAQRWIFGNENPGFKQSLIESGKLPPNPTPEQATAAFKEWYMWQAGMGGIRFSPGQEFKLTDTVLAGGWTPGSLSGIGPDPGAPGGEEVTAAGLGAEGDGTVQVQGFGVGGEPALQTDMFGQQGVAQQQDDYSYLYPASQQQPAQQQAPLTYQQYLLQQQQQQAQTQQAQPQTGFQVPTNAPATPTTQPKPATTATPTTTTPTTQQTNTATQGFYPAATQTAAQTPGGTAGAPTFGATADPNEALWRSAASSIWKPKPTTTPTATI